MLSHAAVQQVSVLAMLADREKNGANNKFEEAGWLWKKMLPSLTGSLYKRVRPIYTPKEFMNEVFIKNLEGRCIRNAFTKG